ncbi:8307_t:CDS:10 [Entrophospora sp. SA101]|nr:8307_t:CDS:10 [Entrophospora sp. SA101]
MFVGAIGALGTGIAIPLMTIIFSGFIQVFFDYNLAINTGQPPEEAASKLEDGVKNYAFYFIALGCAIFVCANLQMCFWIIADIEFFDDTSTGDLTTRVTGDIGIIQEGMSEKVGFIIQQFTCFIGVWKLTLVLCSVFPLLAISGVIMSKSLSSDSSEGQGAYAEAGGVAEQVFSGIRTVVAFGGEQREIQRYISKLEIAYKFDLSTQPTEEDETSVIIDDNSNKLNLKRLTTKASTTKSVKLTDEEIEKDRLENPDGLRSKANFWASMFAVLALVAGLANFCQIALFSLSAEKLTKRLRIMTFTSLVKQEVAFFDDEKNGTGVLTSKLAVDASKVEGLTGSLMGSIIQNATNLVLGLGIAFYFGWKLTLVILAASPIIAIAGYLEFKALAGFGTKTSKAYESTGQIVQQSVSNMRTIASLSREETFKNRFIDALREPHKIAIKGSTLVGFGFGNCSIGDLDISSNINDVKSISISGDELSNVSNGNVNSDKNNNSINLTYKVYHLKVWNDLSPSILRKISRMFHDIKILTIKFCHYVIINNRPEIKNLIESQKSLQEINLLNDSFFIFKEIDDSISKHSETLIMEISLRLEFLDSISFPNLEKLFVFGDQNDIRTTLDLKFCTKIIEKTKGNMKTIRIESNKFLNGTWRYIKSIPVHCPKIQKLTIFYDNLNFLGLSMKEDFENILRSCKYLKILYVQEFHHSNFCFLDGNQILSSLAGHLSSNIFKELHMIGNWTISLDGFKIFCELCKIRNRKKITLKFWFDEGICQDGFVKIYENFVDYGILKSLEFGWNSKKKNIKRILNYEEDIII